MARTNISDLNIRITASSRGLATGVRGAQRQLRGLEESARDIDRRFRGSLASVRSFAVGAGAALASIGAARALKSFAFDGARLAAEAEKIQITFKTLLGSAEDGKEAFDQLQGFAATTPFRLDEVLQAGQLLAAFGTELEDLVPTLRSLGDISAGTGNRLNEIAELFGKARVQGRLFGDDINQLVGRGIPVTGEFANQLGVAESEIKELVSEGRVGFRNLQRAFADLTDEGGRYFDLTSEQSQSLIGQYSTLQDSFDDLKRTFGEGLGPAMAESLQIITEFVGVAEKAKAGLESFSDVEFTLADELKKIRLGFSALPAVINKAAADSLRGFESLAGGFDTLFGSDLSERVSGLRAGLEASARTINTFSDAVQTEVAKIAGGGGNLKTLSDIIEDSAESLRGFGGDAKKAAEQVEDLRKKLEDSAKSIRDSVLTPLERFEEEIREITLSNFYGGLNDEFAGRAINEQVKELTSSVQELQEKLREGVAPIEVGSFEDARLRLQRLRDESVPDVVGPARERANELAKKVREQLRFDIDFGGLEDAEFGKFSQLNGDRANRPLIDTTRTGLNRLETTIERTSRLQMTSLRSITELLRNLAEKEPIEVKQLDPL